MTLKSGNVAYQTGGTGEFYSLNKAKTSVTYYAAKSGSTKLELSGIKGTPTLSGGTVIFDGVSKGDKFNINGKNYTISGKKLK